MARLLKRLINLNSLDTEFEQPYQEPLLQTSGYLRRHYPDMGVDKLDRSPLDELDDDSGDRHISNVLRLKAELPDILSLRLSVLTNMFVHAHKSKMHDQWMYATLSNLTKLHLVIDQDSITSSAYYRLPMDDYENAAHFDCTPILRPFLENIPQVEVLTIDREANGPSLLADPDESPMKIPRWAVLRMKWGTLHWPRLRRLTLRGARIESDDFYEFFENHASTLQSLSLRDVDLTGDQALTWRKFFQLLHDDANSLQTIVLSMQNVDVDMSSRDPDLQVNKALGDYLLGKLDWGDELDSWWSRCGVFESEKEDWSLDGYYRQRLRFMASDLISPVGSYDDIDNERLWDINHN